MRILFLVAVHLAKLLHVAKASEVEYEYKDEYDGDPGAYSLQQGLLQKACTISHMQAYDITTGPIPFAEPKHESPVAPRFSHLNSSTGEQWEFDATSQSGDSGVLIAFYRDPEFAFLGAGNLRLNMDVVWPNGSKYALVEYADDSIIEDCDGHITGTWMKQGGYTYRFKIPRAMDTAEVWIDTPAMKGLITLKSTAVPRYADGSEYPAANASTANIPSMHWFEPIPAASAEVDLTIRGSRLRWKGMGGCERIWQSHTWFEILRGYKFFRAQVGPYAMSYWTATSRFAEGKEVGNVFLAESGRKVFATSKRVEAGANMSDGSREDYFVYTPTFGGDVRGRLKSNLATGYDLEMVSPKDGKRWAFHFEHKQIEFEFNLGNDAGGTAFVGIAVGGQDGSELDAGVFLNESVDFTNLWIPSAVMGALHWYHWLKSFGAAKAKILVDMIRSYSL